MKIGYQGEIGSNSDLASQEFTKRLELKDVEFIPLVTAEQTIKSLINGEIDLAVVATYNKIAGEVIETKQAKLNRNLSIIDKISLPVEHFLFIKNNVKRNNIKKVVSHVQALGQTAKKRSNINPDWKEVEYPDTALAARDLRDNVLDDDCAVICNQYAGKIYKLKLIESNIEDQTGNTTDFELIEFNN